MLGIPPRFCASTEIGRIGEGIPWAYPVASIRQPSRFSKLADLGIIRTPLLQLALRPSGIAHSHIPRQTCIATRLGRVEPHGSGPFRGPNCGHACPHGGCTHLACHSPLVIRIASHRSSLAPQGPNIRAGPMAHMVNKANTRWVAANLPSGHLAHAGNHRHGTAGHRQGQRSAQ